jgi:hypothetical protein
VDFQFRACYLAIPLYICGFVTLGAALEKHLGVAALTLGWGIAELAVMINTVAVYAYCNDSFPKHQVRLNQTDAVVYPWMERRPDSLFKGEISALVNLCRVLGGMHQP